MNKLNELLLTSPDLRAERLKELKRLFPDLVTDEGTLHPETLKQLVDDDAMPTRERYEFNWNGKARAKRHAFTPSRAALTYNAERSVNPEKANGNLIIEGENLEVLKLLTDAYRGEVKCIYIDPPYNTGGDFIYRDDYAQDRKAYWQENGSYEDGIQMDSNPDTAGRYHSDWLSMMYSRLLLGRQLLRDDGVIFASIDDNEVHNLRKLLDEVFGEENFVASVVWQKVYSPRMDAKGFSHDHDYILVYQKTDQFEVGRLEFEQNLKQFTGVDEKTGKRYRPRSLRKEGKNSRREDRPNLYYPLTAPDGTEVYPVRPDGTEGCWRWSRETYAEAKEDNLVEWVKKDEGWQVFVKQYHDENATRPPSTVWPYEEVGHTHEGVEVSKEVLGGNYFDNPKPPRLIKQILKLCAEDNDFVLDFFAGSGTTAQAVMELNEEDESGRRFILVQLPEAVDEDHAAYEAGFRTISEIAIERCNRVIDGYGKSPQPVDSGFDVYRLTKSHFPRVEFKPDPDKSSEENVELLKQYIAEKESSFQITFDQDEVLDEVLLKHGFMLDYSLTEMNEVEENTLYLAADGTREAFICLDIAISDATVDYFTDHADKPFICLERALDTTKKWNLKHHLGDRLKSI